MCNNNIISICVSYWWYQGGVTDYGDNCYTFDFKTGKQLKLKDVCSGYNKKLTKEIKKKLNKKYRNGIMDLDEVSAANVDFYLKKGNKAVVCFDKYELAPGPCEVTLKSTYK